MNALKQHRYKLTTFLITSCIVASISAFSQEPLPKEVLRELRTQVEKPFKIKFAVVTSNIAQTSTENLDSLEKAVRLRIGDSEYQDLFSRANKVVQAAKSQIVIQSETSPFLANVSAPS